MCYSLGVREIQHLIKMKNIVEYKGFKIEIAQDEFPENPFTSYDCEPPLMVCTGSRHGGFTSYQGAPEDLRDVIALLPASCFERGKRVELAKSFGISMRELAYAVQEYGPDIRDAFDYLMDHRYGGTPSGWGDAIEWFGTVETLLKWAGIPCYNGQSNGYSQGHSSLVLAMAPLDWVEKVGAPPENQQEECKSAFDRYGYWAWGDVYGVASITSPEGAELDDSSCWGFYGSNHETSGLMEHARSAIGYFLEKQNEEAENLESALCNLE